MGLYLGRVISEQVRPGIPGALAITVVATFAAVFLLHRLSFQQSWPLCLLLLYVVAPEPDPKTAWMAAFLTAVTFWVKNPVSSRNRVFSVLQSDWRRQALILVMLAGGFLFLYIGTLAPDILPADNGEFQLVAAELGVAHPPGFALYTTLAHLMTRLPLNASPAYKVNLFSALTSTATLLLVYLSVYRLTRRPLAGVTAALALGTATTFWAQATTANIRSLTALFAAAAIYALLRMANEKDFRSTIGNDQVSSDNFASEKDFRSTVLPGNSYRKAHEEHEENKAGRASRFLFTDASQGNR
ncbi:MAG: DUF2723 domain-containing protein, partial [candidate division Zixibacteria bacterium]|nr:DUF2723 domain-containing protein [candidate division Zixibacteria bacterium]